MEHLSSYQVFYTVAKHGNFSRAARELYISQPAISKSIKKLEESLDTTLFIRSSRGVTLTEDGKLLYDHISSAFSAIHEGELRLKRNRELETGQIHIGVSTTLCKHIMLPILQDFILKNPHITVTIDCLSSSETALHLSENTLDIGLIVETNASKQLDFMPLKQLSYSFVASPTYLENLQLREKVDYQKGDSHIFQVATLMLMDQENISRQHAEHYFHEHTIKTGQILETSNMELLVEFAKIGLGVACVIRDFVEEDIKNGTLLEIPLKKDISTRTVGFAYSKDSAYNPSVEKFRRMLAQVI